MADELNRPEIKNFIEAFVEEDIGPGGQYEGMQVQMPPNFSAVPKSMHSALQWPMCR